MTKSTHAGEDLRIVPHGQPTREQLAERYPSINWDGRDWLDLFHTDRGEEVFYAILRDLCRIRWPGAPKPIGQWPTPTGNEQMERLGQIFGWRPPSPELLGQAREVLGVSAAPPYSKKPFIPALFDLIGSMSLRELSRRTGLSAATCSRLAAGKQKPSMATMEIIAGAFDRSPAYFSEYRAHIVAQELALALASVPELVDWAKLAAK